MNGALIVVLCFAAGVSASCPAGCECSPPEVHCSRAGITSFPEDLDPDTTFLDVGHNKLTVIEDDTFTRLGLERLTSLIVDNNTVTEVQPFAFRGLKELSLVQLSGNRITALHPDLFRDNPTIRHVDLTDNPLALPDVGPILVAPSLEWLDLDHCNLTFVPEAAFNQTRNLRYLNLNSNALDTARLPTFRGLSYLRYLKMAGNPLRCDCHVKPLWTWCSQQKISVEATCIWPTNDSWNLLNTTDCSKQFTL